VSPGAALAALLAALAACAATAESAWGRRAPVQARVLAALAALALLPVALHAEGAAALALATGTAILPSPLGCLATVAACVVAGLREAQGAPVSAGAVLAALAAASAASAVSRSVAARVAAGLDVSWIATAAGALASAALAGLGGGQVARWRFALGGGELHAHFPGPGLLLGLGLLAATGGALVLAAHRLGPPPGAAPSALARLAGQRLLLLAAGLLALGSGFVLAQGMDGRAATLAAGAGEVAGLVFVAGLLIVALMVHLGPRGATQGEGLAARETRVAAGLAVLAAAACGAEGVLRSASYATPAALAASAAALGGLAALEATRLTLARRALFFGALLWFLLA
jgi:hypothetical protein